MLENFSVQDLINISDYFIKVENVIPFLYLIYGLDPVSATPHYNTSVLTDMLMEQHLHFLYGKISQHQSLIDAIVLCKVWLYQRHLHEVGFSVGAVKILGSVL